MGRGVRGLVSGALGERRGKVWCKVKEEKYQIGDKNVYKKIRRKNMIKRDGKVDEEWKVKVRGESENRQTLESWKDRERE